MIKILVIDDDEITCSRCARVLIKEGYEVLTSFDGKSAIELIAQNSFEIVLTDLNLPGVTGVDILKKVKEKQSATEVIIITGYPSVETAVEAIKIGAYDYLKKPINIDELLIVIERCLEKNKLKKELDIEKKLRQELEEAHNKLKETQAQLIQSEKLAAIGTLAAGVAHEINNPLQAIMLQVSFLSDCITEDNILNKIKIIENELDRASTIVKSLLSFSRKKKIDEKKKININAVIDETLKSVEYQFNLQNIRIIKECSEDLKEIFVNSQELQQVLLNLFTNARDAIIKKKNEVGKEANENEVKKEGLITVKTYNDKINVIIEIHDNGSGIPEGKINNLFTPFFTTKEVGKGTGLGLYISKGIIESYNGKIEILSKEGEGTTFRILFV